MASEATVPLLLQPAEAQQPPRRDYTLAVWCVRLSVVAIFAGVVAGAVALGLRAAAPMPSCRKSAAVAAFSEYSHPGSALRNNACGDEGMLIIYGGKGKQTKAFDDAWLMCMDTKRWSLLARDGHSHSDDDSEPSTRWKTVYMTGKSGLYVMGGSQLQGDDPAAAEESETSGPFDDKEEYYNDIWLYSVGNKFGWKLVHPGGKGKQYPHTRRAHVGIIYQDIKGSDVVVIHGGRDKKDNVLNDVWEFHLGTKEWTQLFDPDTTTYAPPERKGHVAFVAPHPTGEKPYFVIHGGRPGSGYYGDIWAFDLNTGEWQEWFNPDTANVTETGEAPEPRDHHVGHYFNNRIYIHGGRGGVDRVWENAKQFADLWAFDIPSKMWIELSPRGHKPIGRWLHTLAGHVNEPNDPIQEGIMEVDRFVITGGEDISTRCYMNDVWEYSVNRNTWIELQKCTFCEKSCVKALPTFLP